MDQDTRWLKRYNEVRAFIETNHRNPSKYDAEERGDYYTWMKHNRKVMNAGKMKPERIERFKELLELTEKYKRVNQYQ
ncbi:MAG: helicase associated domain-containing protein [Prevotella sp.]|nr:helicase associated domain-containing protein [Prevotella sp.]